MASRTDMAGLGLAIEMVEIGASLLRWSEDVGRLVSLGYAGEIVGGKMLITVYLWTVLRGICIIILPCELWEDCLYTIC